MSDMHQCILQVECMLQAASRGQVGVTFTRESCQGGNISQEDVLGKIIVGGDWVRMEACEVKHLDYISVNDDPVTGIHRNKAAFGQACGPLC